MDRRQVLEALTGKRAVDADFPMHKWIANQERNGERWQGWTAPRVRAAYQRYAESES